MLSNHIVRVIFGNGMFCYSSELRLNGGDQSATYGNGVYDEYFQKGDINQVYKSAYISRLKFNNEYVITVHNDPFSDVELDLFHSLRNQFADLLQEESEKFDKLIDKYFENTSSDI